MCNMLLKLLLLAIVMLRSSHLRVCPVVRVRALVVLAALAVGVSSYIGIGARMYSDAALREQVLAADLVAHFEERNQAQDGKAMAVTMSREICVHLYNEIVKLRPDWHSDDPEQGAIKIIMTVGIALMLLQAISIFFKDVAKFTGREIA